MTPQESGNRGGWLGRLKGREASCKGTCRRRCGWFDRQVDHKHFTGWHTACRIFSQRALEAGMRRSRQSIHQFCGRFRIGRPHLGHLAAQALPSAVATGESHGQAEQENEADGLSQDRADGDAQRRLAPPGDRAFRLPREHQPPGRAARRRRAPSPSRIHPSRTRACRNERSARHRRRPAHRRTPTCRFGDG